MSMSIGLSLHVSQRQERSQQLTHAQRIAVQTKQLKRLRSLTGALNGGRFTPKATCPSCGRGLKDAEIMRGFLDDPRDFTTQCPRCKHRFAPRLVRHTAASTIEVALFCPQQTLDQLKALQDLPVTEIEAKHAGVYHSALLHFGGLAQAFKRAGFTYAHAADLDWKKAAKRFVGKLADTVIARLVGATAAAVGKLRRSLGIERYHVAQDV